MTASAAICYTTDIHFLLPSLISAIRIRRAVEKEQASLFICLIDAEEMVSRLNDHFSSQNIFFINLDSSAYKAVDPQKFRRTGLPTSALGRFFLHELLPSSYSRILYLDGDIWPAQTPLPLLLKDIPEGFFLAAEDFASFKYTRKKGPHEFLSTYFSGIGLDWKKYGYFNSGVLAASRSTWREISNEAFQYLIDNTEKCRFHDQSALNAIGQSRRLPLSMRWNFQTPLKFLKADRKITPSLFHFTKFPKPWMRPCVPWKEMFPLYEQEASLLSSLDLPKRIATEEELRRNIVENKKNLLLGKLPFLENIALPWLGISAYEKRAWI